MAVGSGVSPCWAENLLIVRCTGLAKPEISSLIFAPLPIHQLIYPNI